MGGEETPLYLNTSLMWSLNRLGIRQRIGVNNNIFYYTGKLARI
jgi:hypothetical protein